CVPSAFGVRRSWSSPESQALRCGLCALCVPCAEMRLDDLNALDEGAATRELQRCCGSSRWARQMVAARPFATFAATAQAADATWSALDRADWLQGVCESPEVGGG